MADIAARAALLQSSSKDEAITVNQRALIDKVSSTRRREEGADQIGYASGAEGGGERRGELIRKGFRFQSLIQGGYRDANSIKNVAMLCTLWIAMPVS